MIKICYTERNNLGDAINPLILDRVLGCEFQRTDEYECDMTGIGSGLRRFFVNQSSLKKWKGIKKFVNGRRHTAPVILWSAGFLTSAVDKELLLRKNVLVASVRGELSKQRVEGVLGKKLDATTGDAGLLCSELIKEKVNKKYRLGIIPHDREREEEEYFRIQEETKDSVIIDVRKDPMEMLRLMAECECIISSSLHGLIIADSFHIPNKQVILTDKLAGDGFKFRDYYSCFGLEQNAQDLRIDRNIDIDKIIGEYPVSYDAVEQKKIEIVDAFKRYL